MPRDRKPTLDAAALLAPLRLAYVAFVEQLTALYSPRLLTGEFDWTEEEKWEFGWPDGIARTLSVHMEKFEEAVSRYCKKPEVARLILSVSRHAEDVEGTEGFYFASEATYCLTRDILDAGVAAGKLTPGQVAAWWSSWHEPLDQQVVLLPLDGGQPPESRP